MKQSTAILLLRLLIEPGLDILLLITLCGYGLIHGLLSVGESLILIIVIPLLLRIYSMADKIMRGLVR